MALFRTQVRLAFPVGAGGGTNTWHVRTDEGMSPEDAEDIGSALEDFYVGVNSLFPPSMSAVWDGAFTEIATEEPGVAPSGLPFTQAGDGGTDYGATAGMACVTWRTALATRSGRGRTFLGPLAATAVEADGTLAASRLTELRAAAAALVDVSTGLNAWAFGVFSPTDGVLRDFTAATVTDQVAILRSRRG